MFGIKYIKFDSMTYVIHYTNGKIKKEGRGLSFYYWSMSSSIAAIPMGSNDIPFIFNESTSDFQTISIQGQITYQVTNPKQLAELLDFSVDGRGNYKSNDAEKITQRLTNEAQTATSAYIHGLQLTEAIRSAPAIEKTIMEGIKESEAVKMLGIEPLSVNVIAIKASPEMEKALEAKTREALQQEADQATYGRRNFAVEQERKIKESELNTEIAVEEKRKQIVEKQMETKILTEENNRKIQHMQMETDILLEEKKQQLVSIQTDNERKQAETKGFVLETTLKPYKDLDWKTIMAIGGNSDAKLNISLAFRELAENTDKIQNLNISPDLLNSLLNESEEQNY